MKTINNLSDCNLIYQQTNQIETSRRNKAAITIQKCFKGYSTRQAFLSHKNYKKYQAYLVKTGDMPKASSGGTPVFLPNELPEIIFKKSGRNDAIKRFQQMLEARKVLNTIKSSHLVIPKAILCDDYMVEERLPVNSNYFYCPYIYYKYKEKFEPCVREITCFFSKVYLSDLVSGQRCPTSNIVDDLVRYDNLPFYFDKSDEKKTKIGLIDLEHLALSPSQKGLKTVARIFPFHLKTILDEAEKLNLSFNKDDVKNAANLGEKYLSDLIIRHLEWLNQHKIDKDTVFKSFEINQKRACELRQVIKEEILRLNEGKNYTFNRMYPGCKDHVKDFLPENREEFALSLADKLCELMVNHVKQRLLDKQEEIFKGKVITIRDESDLICLRSLFIRRHKFYKPVDKILRNMERNGKLDKFSFLNDASIMADQIVNVFLQELVTGGEILSYDPGYSSGAHKFSWLRF